MTKEQLQLIPVTRETATKTAQTIWQEAFLADEQYTLEVTELVTGSQVFCWSTLTIPQLRALSRTLFTTARLS